MHYVPEWRKISTTNAHFVYKSDLETELSQINLAKKTWLAFQGSFYEDNPSAIVGANGQAEDVAERKRIVAASIEFRLFDGIACDFLSCDKHLINGVTISLSMRRSPIDFVILSEHRDKHYQVEITEANLNYIEVLPRNFWPQLLCTAGDKFVE